MIDNSDSDKELFENKTIILESIWKTLFYPLSCLLFLIGSFMMDKEEVPFAYWGGIILFGTGALVFIIRIFNPKNLIIPTGSDLEKRYIEYDNDKRINGTGCFEYTDTGFTLSYETSEKTVNWDEVDIMLGYKVDQFAVDCIVLKVFLDDGQFFNINEDTPGWHQFTVKSKYRFPEIDKAWDIKIQVPAFETTLTLIYDKQGRTIDEVVPELDESEENFLPIRHK